MRKFIFLLNLLMFAETQRDLRRFSMKSHRLASSLNVRVFKKTEAFEISVFPIVYNNENDVDAIQHISALFDLISSILVFLSSPLLRLCHLSL